MNLTDHTDYALRVLMYLNQTKQLTTLDELSKRLNVSRNNLIKISNRLAKFGYIEAIRGRNGGVKIHKEAGSTTLGAIVRRTEERVHLAECFSSSKKIGCSFFKSCGLKRHLYTAYEAFLGSLDEKTLDDITPPKSI